MARFFVTVTQDDAGNRLPGVLKRHMQFFSSADIDEAIRDGGVYQNKHRQTDPDTVVTLGDEITVYYYETPHPAGLRLNAGMILFEDNWMLAINKPSGIAAEMTRQGKRHTVTEMLEHYLHGGYFRTIHRLDMGTSGVLLIGKKPQATKFLMAQFQNHLIRKKYIARVSGIMTPNSATIETRLDRDPTDPRRMKSSESGKTAITRYRTLKVFDDEPATLLEVDLLTGRMHQIRVHLSESGHPVLGDWLYGDARSADRLMLHAAMIQFRHPHSREVCIVEAPVPMEFGLTGSPNDPPGDNRQTRKAT